MLPAEQCPLHAQLESEDAGRLRKDSSALAKIINLVQTKDISFHFVFEPSDTSTPDPPGHWKFGIPHPQALQSRFTYAKHLDRCRAIYQD